ncbi:MAG: Trm112 family protein [Elusimicrobia bacterium]|nr:Trm112 family protein [Elusimicrobiota bacterium]
MTLSKECRDVLACPKCKGPLDYRSEEQRFVCFYCRLSYPLREGIPVMLVDQAVAF